MSQLGVFEFEIDEFNKMLQLPMIMLDLERQVIGQELGMLMGIENIPPDQIHQASQTPGYSPSQNYEVLETVGDSILKYISTFIVFQQFGHYRNEDFLTQKRSEFLGQVLYESNFDRFMKVQFYNYIDWLSPVLDDIFSNGTAMSKKIFSSPKIKLTSKVCADFYEALMGAAFMSRCTFQESYHFLKITNHPLTISSKPINEAKYLNVTSVNISLPMDSQQAIFSNLETTFRSLCSRFIEIPPDVQQQIEASMKEFLEIKSGEDFLQIQKPHQLFSFLEYLQSNILQYRFQQIQLLIEAITIKSFNNNGNSRIRNYEIFKSLSPEFFQDRQFIGYQNYEKLEFLGDAVIEGLVVPNAYLGFQNIGLEVNPQMMSKIKMILLGNSFMARQCIANGMHHFMLNKQGACSDIVQFEKLVNFDTPFKDFVGNIIAVPKCLSDIWESICGAILLDGGWPAVMSTYGSLYRPFIQFICNFIFEVEDHVIVKVIHYCQEKFQRFEFLMLANHICQILGDGAVLVEEQGENEKVAKEKACHKFCEKFIV